MGLNLRVLRRKIRTVRHIQQITRAMNLVAAAKLSRAQQIVQAGRSYYERLRQVTEHVAAVGELDHPYLQAREVNAVAVLVVGGDRGLCGGFNSSIWESAADYVADQATAARVITVGNRMERLARRAGVDVVRAWPGLSGPQDAHLAAEIASVVRGMYEQGEVDVVQAVYADFVSVVRHPVRNEQLLPIVRQGIAGEREAEYLFEPPAEQLLSWLLPRAVDAETRRILLATHTAEQAARMMAMSAATDNAEDMIEDLTRQLNRARQEEITAELLDVVGGAQAVSEE